MTLRKHISLSTAWLACAAAALFPATAHAQYRPVPPQQTYQPGPNPAAAAQANVYRSGYAPVRQPTGVYPGAVNVYGAVPPGYGAGSALSGASDVITAKGNYMIQQQEALLTQEGVRQARTQSRKAYFDQKLYEKAMTPTEEELRLDQQYQDLSRARYNPPLPAIWSGDAMNMLLKEIQRNQTYAATLPTVLVDPEMIRRLNLTDGKVKGLGLLKDGGKLEWPVPLQDPAYAAPVKEITETYGKAVEQAKTSTVDAAYIRKLQTAQQKLQTQWEGALENMDPNDWITGKRFIAGIKDSIKMLQDPTVTSQLTGKWSVQAATAGELVNELTRKGLQFAPALKGEENAYNAVYQSLAAYDRGLTRPAERK